MAAGVIYVLMNPSLKGLLKIGKTTKTAEERAAEISSSTGVPRPFYVAYDDFCEDCDKAEKIIHRRLSEYKEGKEFFKIAFKHALRIIVSVIEEVDKETKQYEETTSSQTTVNSQVEAKFPCFEQGHVVQGPSPLCVTPHNLGRLSKLDDGNNFYIISDGHFTWQSQEEYGELALEQIVSIQLWRVARRWGHYQLVIQSHSEGRASSILVPDNRVLLKVYRLLTNAGDSY